MNVHDLHDKYQTRKYKDNAYFFEGKEITGLTAENGGYFLTFKAYESTCYGKHFFYGDEKIFEICKEYQERYRSIMASLPEKAEPPMTEHARKLLKIYIEKTEPTEKELLKIYCLTASILKLDRGHELEAAAEAIQIVNNERR